MFVGQFSATEPNLPNFWPNLTHQSQQSNQPNQLVLMPKLKFSQCGINTVRVVKSILNMLKACKNDMHEKYM